ncbi:protein pufQ [Rhodobacterales bacterium HKCCE4037]|nr:protein pufQ [Rhodobacterales bacterium HKCCE4037]
MTDMTTETMVTPQVRHRRTPAADRAEYQVYFALIFAVLLPVNLVAWARDAITGNGNAGKGPVVRSLSHARTITPQIFRA